MLSARRCKVFHPRLRGEEQLLQVRPAHPLQPPPLLDGEEHCRFHPALSHDLRPFGEGSIEELAEPRLGVLNRPFPARDSPHLSMMLTS